MVLLVLASAGCGQRGSPVSGSDGGSSGRPSADELLARLVKTYRETPEYFDRGEIRLEYDIGGQSHIDRAPFTAHFQRPDTLYVHAYQSEFACERRRLVAVMQDDGTGNLDDQVVSREIASPVTLDTFLEDLLLGESLAQGLGRLPIQLELLLADEALAGFRQPQTKRRLLEDRPHTDSPCYRVEVTTAEGPFVLWISQPEGLLVKLEYPPALATARLPADFRPSAIRLVAEFRGASFAWPNARPPAMATPQEPKQKLVRRFVRPPQPLPTNLYGQVAQEMRFTSLDGTPASIASGRITVLQWFVNHPACRAAMEQLERVRLATHDAGVQFFAVCVEPTDVPDDAVQALLRDWNVAMPVVRDLSATGRDVFAIEALPAIVVLDAQGRVQVFEVTFNPSLSEQLPRAIAELQAGGDLASQVLAQVQNDTTEYHRLLAAAGYHPPVEPYQPNVPAEEIVWRQACDGLGNLATMRTTDGQTRIVGLVHGRALAQWDIDGQELARSDLLLPPGEFATLIRPQSPQIAVAARGGHAYYVVNEQGKPVASLTQSTRRATFDGIFDLAWRPNTDGVPALWVGTFASGPALTWFDTPMAQGDIPYAQSMVAVGGRRRTEWHAGRTAAPSGPQARNASLGQSNDLASVAVADAGGRLSMVASSGRDEPAADRLANGIFAIAAADVSDETTTGPEYLGLSYTPSGDRIAVGLDVHFRQLWQVSLPVLPVTQPVELAVASPAVTRRTWLVSLGGDRVACLGQDGSVLRQWAFGHPVTGMSTCASAQGPLAVIATTQELIGLRLP